MTMRRKPRASGFSLLEMMVVLTILSILLAIASPHLLRMADSIEARIKLTMMARQIEATLVQQEGHALSLLGDACPACTHCGVYARSQPQSLRSASYFSTSCQEKMKGTFQKLGVDPVYFAGRNFAFSFDPNIGETAQYGAKCVPDHLYASSRKSGAVYVFVMRTEKCKSIEGEGFHSYLAPTVKYATVLGIPNVTKPLVLTPAAP